MEKFAVAVAMLAADSAIQTPSNTHTATGASTVHDR
jgi:hypothetical protein